MTRNHTNNPNRLASSLSANRNPSSRFASPRNLSLKAVASQPCSAARVSAAIATTSSTNPDTGNKPYRDLGQ